LFPTFYQCSYQHDGIKATYDLSKLQETGPHFIRGGDLECTWDTVEQNYTYFFAFCGSVAPPAPSCTGHAGAVVQMDYAAGFANQCKSAGLEETAEYALADEANPAAGFKVTYTSGDLCHTLGRNRRTTVVALCEDALEATMGSDQVREVGGAKMCDYEIIFHSSYACPKQCPVAGDERKSCGGNGHCRYDTDAKAARCFCSNGWGGADCMTDLNAGVSGTIVGLTVTVTIFALMLAGALAMLYKQVKDYRSDANNYLKLRGQEMITNESI
jgi:hypothetical protein